MNNDDNRPFPIQGNDTIRNLDGTTKYPVRYTEPCTIPWWLAEVAYEWYAKRFGNQQSLERLADRGGFGRGELVGLIRREK